MKTQIRRLRKLIAHHSWWLWAAIAAVGACYELANLASGAKMTRFDFINWVALALVWMMIYLLTAFTARRNTRH